jgi:hypothetical protein
MWGFTVCMVHGEHTEPLFCFEPFFPVRSEMQKVDDLLPICNVVVVSDHNALWNSSCSGGVIETADCFLGIFHIIPHEPLGLFNRRKEGVPVPYSKSSFPCAFECRIIEDEHPVFTHANL